MRTNKIGRKTSDQKKEIEHIIQRKTEEHKEF